jgi:hypothetical protein
MFSPFRCSLSALSFLVYFSHSNRLNIVFDPVEHLVFVLFLFYFLLLAALVVLVFVYYCYFVFFYHHSYLLYLFHLLLHFF